MLKKTMEYTNYNGVKVKEDFYFNLTEAELTEMEMGIDGGLAEMIQSIVDANDVKAIIKVFKDILLAAYGEKSADGRRFMKSEEIKNGFAHTEAYSILFMELATDADKAAEFINGIVPASISKQVSKATHPAVK